MAEDKQEKDVVELQSVNWVRGLLGDVSGKIATPIFQEIILGNRYKTGVCIEDNIGAGILEPSVGIVFAYDSNDISKYLIYAYIRKHREYANRVMIAANGISLGAQNDQGTSNVIGGDTQICFYIRN
ncbi:hypothetical protein [Bacteroides hominis]|uniref:hypothetical protein n=1 Tax=Bacteroides hominis TaxID=2763023 RepID=UPI00164B14DD|nr:hypothetical protein [Bacteroides hominis (ex Liu et al. 2022)]MBC5612891.1 hypothetical protein [Bacteroides hominis (ex Liu et al. 2022)]